MVGFSYFYSILYRNTVSKTTDLYFCIADDVASNCWTVPSASFIQVAVHNTAYVPQINIGGCNTDLAFVRDGNKIVAYTLM